MAETVLVVDDNALWLLVLKDALAEQGYGVLTAPTLANALALIPRLNARRVRVAVVNANLHKGSYSGDDGKFLTDELTRLVLGIKIVVTSALQRYDYGDRFVSKSDGPEAVLKAITELVA